MICQYEFKDWEKLSKDIQDHFSIFDDEEPIIDSNFDNFDERGNFMSYQSKFADSLRKKMEQKEISQATVSRLTGFNSGTISRICSGKRAVSYETIAKVATKLNMWRGRTPDEMVQYIEELEVKLVATRRAADRIVKFNIAGLLVILGMLICAMM